MMGDLHEWTAGCLYATAAHGVSYWDYSTGLHCCR